MNISGSGPESASSSAASIGQDTIRSENTAEIWLEFIGRAVLAVNEKPDEPYICQIIQTAEAGESEFSAVLALAPNRACLDTYLKDRSVTLLRQCARELEFPENKLEILPSVIKSQREELAKEKRDRARAQAKATRSQNSLTKSRNTFSEERQRLSLREQRVAERNKALTEREHALSKRERAIRRLEGQELLTALGKIARPGSSEVVVGQFSGTASPSTSQTTSQPGGAAGTGAAKAYTSPVTAAHGGVSALFQEKAALDERIKELEHHLNKVVENKKVLVGWNIELNKTVQDLRNQLATKEKEQVEYPVESEHFFGEVQGISTEQPEPASSNASVDKTPLNKLIDKVWGLQPQIKQSRRRVEDSLRKKREMEVKANRFKLQDILLELEGIKQKLKTSETERDTAQKELSTMKTKLEWALPYAEPWHELVSEANEQFKGKKKKGSLTRVLNLHGSSGSSEQRFKVSITPITEKQACALAKDNYQNAPRIPVQLHQGEGYLPDNKGRKAPVADVSPYIPGGPTLCDGLLPQNPNPELDLKWANTAKTKQVLASTRLKFMGDVLRGHCLSGNVSVAPERRRDLLERSYEVSRSETVVLNIAGDDSGSSKQGE